MVMRYATLVALAGAAVWGVIALSASSAQMYVVDFDHTASFATQNNASFWLLASVATLITLSLCRFVVFGLPSLVNTWCQGNKTWLYMAVLGGAAYGVLYLM
jgi:hypothetical protein